MEKCVDAVVYVTSHEEVEKLVQLAMKHNVALIPFGGGTNGFPIIFYLILFSYTSITCQTWRKAYGNFSGHAKNESYKMDRSNKFISLH